MITRNTIKGFVVCLLLTTSTAAMAQGQDGYFRNGDYDAEWFSPVEIDFENRPIRRDTGYFFRYDKLSWAVGGERNTVGDPNVQVLSEIIIPDALAEAFGITSGPLRSADFQYPIINGLQDVAPTTQFAWGERYEFGYFSGDNGWQISILDGPEANSAHSFGNGTGQNGFGAIHINFATPDNFLLGFRDYWGSGAEEGTFVPPTTTLNGPNGPGDGIVDDLDGDGAEGAVFIVGPNPADPTGDEIVLGIAIDLDDLHMFNVTFNQVNVRSVTETQGVELMRTYRFNNRSKMVKRQGNHFELGYGFRFLRLRDSFSFDGTSDLLGATSFTTEAENQIIGPQIRLKWSRQRGRWNLGLDGRCLLGYNITDADQTGAIGVDDPLIPNSGLVPGALNRLISGQPTIFSYGRQNNEFSPTIEFRADASYQVTSAIALRLGYTATFVDNISRAAQITRYYLPDMGLREGGKQEIFINGANFGFDVVF